MLDKKGFCQAVEIDVYPEVPTYKCEKERYKKAMKEAFAKAGFVPPLGGVEYGKDIALEIDFYTAQKADATFKHLLNELQSTLRSFHPVNAE